jgi:hypothetical protein
MILAMPISDSSGDDPSGAAADASAPSTDAPAAAAADASASPDDASPATYSVGTDFNCTPDAAGTTHCSPVTDEVKSAFVNLQMTINLFAQTVGFTAVATDGDMSNDTFNAAQQVCAYIQGNPALLPAGLALPPTIDDLAAYAAQYTAAFSTAASAMSGTSPAPADASSADMSPAPGTESLPDSAKSSNTWMWVAGSILLAVTAGTVGYVIYKSRHRRLTA